MVAEHSVNNFRVDNIVCMTNNFPKLHVPKKKKEEFKSTHNEIKMAQEEFDKFNHR